MILTALPEQNNSCSQNHGDAGTHCVSAVLPSRPREGRSSRGDGGSTGNGTSSVEVGQWWAQVTDQMIFGFRQSHTKAVPW